MHADPAMAIPAEMFDEQGNYLKCVRLDDKLVILGADVACDPPCILQLTEILLLKPD